MNLTGYESGWVNSISFDNRGLLVSADESIKTWSATTGKFLKTLTDHINYVNSVSFDNHGLLTVGSKDGSIK